MQSNRRTNIFYFVPFHIDAVNNVNKAAVLYLQNYIKPS